MYVYFCIHRRPRTGLPVHQCGPELAGSCADVRRLRAFFRLLFHLLDAANVGGGRSWEGDCTYAIFLAGSCRVVTIA